MSISPISGARSSRIVPRVSPAVPRSDSARVNPAELRAPVPAPSPGRPRILVNPAPTPAWASVRRPAFAPLSPEELRARTELSAQNSQFAASRPEERFGGVHQLDADAVLSARKAAEATISALPFYERWTMHLLRALGGGKTEAERDAERRQKRNRKAHNLELLEAYKKEKRAQGKKPGEAPSRPHYFSEKLWRLIQIAGTTGGQMPY